jgi:putative ATP-binding cassette transporter
MLQRIAVMIRDIVADPLVGSKALLYFAGLCSLLLIISGLNVINSYVGRDFMTAIADHNRAGFWRYAMLYLVVFAALTFFSVMQRYLEESLGLLWRKWMTAYSFRRYADHRVYWQLAEGRTIENPDQRIAEDIKAFTTTTLSFVLMLLNGGLTVIAFSGVLWTISPLLFLVAIVYAMVGTWFTFRLGRPLIRLNYDQSDREADFRSALIHLSENADSVALSRREDLWMLRLSRYLHDLTNNLQKIIGINRQVGFFTTGYSWLIQLIPVLFVAPLFIDGRVEFGVITQASLAFTQLLGAFSLIITQFQSISSFAAVVSRLSALTDASHQAEEAEITSSALATEHEHIRDQIVYRNVTLLAEQSRKPLIDSLSVTWHAGECVHVIGTDDAAGDALFRATSGIRPVDQGQLLRPPLEQILFITERPYLCPGTLREAFLKPHPELQENHHGPLDEQALSIADSRIRSTLKTLGLGRMIQRFGGLDAVHDWDSVLSLEEQQLLVIARAMAVKPRFVFLDRPDTSLPAPQIEKVLKVLGDQNITQIIFSKNGLIAPTHLACLELKTGGKWLWTPGKS